MLKVEYLFKSSLTLILITLLLSINQMQAWSPPVTISNGGNNQMVSVAFDNSGNITVVWINGTYPLNTVKAASCIAGVWSPPTILTDIGIYSNPKVEVNSNGSAIVVWEYCEDDNRVIQSISLPFGGNWTDISTISFLGINESPDLVIDDEGNAIAIWLNSSRNLICIAKKPNLGSWHMPETLASSIGTLRPQIEMNPLGMAIALWSSQDLSSFTSTYSSGIWSTPVALDNSQTQRNDEGGLSINALGFCVASWTQSNSGKVWGSTKTPNGSWSDPATIISNDGPNSPPQVALADTNNAVAVWTDFNQLSVEASSYINGIWNTPVTISDNLGNQDAQIIVDQNGNATAIWQSWDGGAIMTRNLTLNNNGWDDNPTKISNDHYYNNSPKLVINSSGKAAAVWIANDGENTFVQTSFN